MFNKFKLLLTVLGISTMMLASAQSSNNTREGEAGYFKWSKTPEEAMIMLAYYDESYTPIFGPIKKLTMTTAYYENGEVSHYHYLQWFDEQGRLTKDRYYESDGSLTSLLSPDTYSDFTQIEYLPNNGGIRIRYKDSEGVKGVYKLKYDPNQLEQLMTVESGDVPFVRFTFDAAKGEFSSAWYQEDYDKDDGSKDYLYPYTCRLNQQGLIDSGCLSDEETAEDSYVLEYDDKQQIIAQYERNLDGSKGDIAMRYEYVYDKYGNWTSRKVDYLDGTYDLDERKFVYY